MQALGLRNKAYPNCRYICFRKTSVMLSICIPVYNYNVRSLVKSLHDQAVILGVPVEILVLDDCSESDYRNLNHDISEFELVRYELLNQNAGRSRIRNLMAAKARYQWLIIMDCDSATPDDLFLKRYLEETSGDALVCGGRIYTNKPVAGNTTLHWRYGTMREVKNVAQRSQHPHRWFMTNNFMVQKSVMKQIPFNENIKGYGHEDTLFGYELKEKGIRVKHIENPLVHIGLQSNTEFLAKSREGVQNLAFINNYLDQGHDLGKMVRLLAWYKALKRLKMCGVFAFFFGLFKYPVEKNLLGKTPFLYLFDIYKLGYFCQNRHQT